MTRHFLALLAALALWATPAAAQDDLLDLLPETSTPQYAKATFKATRIISGHSIENMAAGHLDFRIAHRFGRLNSGATELWGLDFATMRMSLEYGLSDRLMVGIGRSSFEKVYDGFAKAKLLRQAAEGSEGSPVSLSLFAGGYLSAMPLDPKPPFRHRVSYAFQALIARKFSDRLSLQLSPTMLHRNVTYSIEDYNDVYALGIGGRFKLSSRVSFNVEYFLLYPNRMSDQFHAPLSFGFDIETGGHVFQLHFTNSLGMTERQFIGGTTGQWGKGDIHYGFNISRTFSLAKRRPSAG
jgi:hypothetical protein